MKTRKPQQPKPRNLAYAKAMQELRRSSAAEPHKNKNKYRRPKAGARNREW